jgi:hypothetical protein
MYQIALACQQEGILKRFITGGYLKNDALIKFLKSPCGQKRTVLFSQQIYVEWR